MTTTGGPHLRVASWNVLADAYIKADWFPHTGAQLLAPGARIDAVLALAVTLDADVLAFQEADPALVAAARERLDGYDVRWCPKGRGRADGCLTAVRRPWTIMAEAQHLYEDSFGGPISGHVAHVLELRSDAGVAVSVANTHLRWAAPGTTGDTHVGVRQAWQLVGLLAGKATAVIAADTNDSPDGPVRAVLRAAGFHEAVGLSPTSIVAGTQVQALDVVAARGVRCTALPIGIRVQPPLPGPACPSDHVPVLTTIG